jgi:2-polyprenyl-3-methyl-5-hydroxy-6-metoxy-1,4-benzoquinol methylase
MEVEKVIQREYNPDHPNYERWQKARDLSEERAKFVENIISNEINPSGLKILDVGAGEGSTSKLFSQKNIVISLEPKPERIKNISSSNSLHPVIADSLNLPLKDTFFDIIILQDVIEHLNFKKKLISDLTSLLNDDGFLYLSTPNKFSLINVMADPHWGMPFLALFKREQIKKYFLKIFRKNDYNRDDIAELLSLNEIIQLFGENFSIKIQTKYSIDYLLNGGKGLVWSKFHLLLVKLVNILDLKKILLNIANGKPGIINKFFTPTFYIIIKKK